MLVCGVNIADWPLTSHSYGVGGILRRRRDANSNRVVQRKRERKVNKTVKGRRDGNQGTKAQPAC